MNVTINDLKILRKECDRMSQLCKEIENYQKVENTQRKLFCSREDYQESLKIKNQIPQDYYFCRVFDIFIQIVYNKKDEMYSIYLDGYYSHQLDKFKRLQRFKNSYLISRNFDFTLHLFQSIIVEIINSKVLQNGLF